MNPPRQPSVLFVFYTHTQQSVRVERCGHVPPKMTEVR
jgi:hypothetical protein